VAITSSFNNKPNQQISPEPSPADLKYEEDFKSSSSDSSLRPKSFDNYIGQPKLRQILDIAISAALKRNDISSIGHILLYGPPGLGKTSCAYLLAKALGTNAHIFSAPALERPKDILGILMSVSEGDVVFIDEIHRINKITEELLYPALEDFQIDLSSGKGNSSRMMRLDINKFILVGATTKLGYLSAPLRDRFIHVHRMEYYDAQELALIIKQSANILEINIETEAALCLAQASRGTPRIANRLLRLVRDYASHLNQNIIKLETSQKALDLYKIDHFGLDSMDRRILELIQDTYKGGPTGLESLASLTGEDKMTLEDYYEPFLIQSGFLVRTQRGRMITDKAKEYLKLSRDQ
jgi:Holliday junction DNA helicase RuvB